MRVLVISYEYPPFNGGVGVVAAKIHETLKGNSTVLTAKGSLDADDRILRRLPLNSGILRYIFGVVFLVYYLIRLKTTNIIAVCPTSQRLCYALSFIAPIKYVCIVHGSEIFWNNKKRKWGIDLKGIYHNSAANFAVSDYVSTLLAEIGAPNIQRFQLGLSSEKLKPLSLKRQNSLISISRLDRRKGHEEIIYALSMVNDNEYDFRYIIAGEGAEQEKLVQLVKKLNLQLKIEFVGSVTEDEKHELLSSSKVYVLHSIQNDDTVEGYGISYLEAGLYCDYVIGSDHGGVPEALSALPNSFTVPAGDIKTLSKVLMQALSDDRNQPIPINRERLMRELNQGWRLSVQKILDVLNA